MAGITAEMRACINSIGRGPTPFEDWMSNSVHDNSVKEAVMNATKMNPIASKDMAKDSTQKLDVFTKAIMELSKHCWAFGDDVSKIFETNPDAFKTGVQFNVQIHDRISVKMSAVQSASQFISIIPEDDRPIVSLKKNHVVLAVLRLQGADGKFTFRPAVLSKGDKETRFSAEMCFFVPGKKVNGNQRAIAGSMEKGVNTGRVYILKIHRNFCPNLSRSKLKTQLALDNFHTLKSFINWANDKKTKVAEKNSEEANEEDVYE